MSPSLLDRYVAAAAKISRLAVGERDAAPNQVTYTVKGDLSQNQTLDGQPFGTRGGTIVRHNFPVDGEYAIRLSLLKLSFGQVFGDGAEGEALEVTLNGERVKVFRLDEVPMFFMRESPGSHPPKPTPTDPLEERVKMTPDLRLEFRLNVKAGPQTIGVAFLQKNFAANEDLVRRPAASTFDVFIGMDGHDVPHLSRVVITGPMARPVRDTPSRRRVSVCHLSAHLARDGASEGGCARQIVATLVRRAPGARRWRPISTRLASIRRSAIAPATSRRGSRWRLPDPGGSRVVFRFELPPASVAPGTPYRIRDIELASRLSFFLCPRSRRRTLSWASGKVHEPAVLRNRRAGCSSTEGAHARDQLREPVAPRASRRTRFPMARCFDPDDNLVSLAGNGDAFSIRARTGRSSICWTRTTPS